jgi:hypothetical protein
VKVLRLIFFSATGTAVVCVYAVAPIAVGLRPLLGGFLLPFAIAFAVIGVCAVRIVVILRRTAPFTETSSELLTMPVLNLDSPPAQELAGSRGRALQPRALLPLPAATITEGYNVTPLR